MKRATVIRRKTGRPVQFAIVAEARNSVMVWRARRGYSLREFVFPHRVELASQQPRGHCTLATPTTRAGDDTAEKSLQKFAAVHDSIDNQFFQERHLVDRQTCKLRRLIELVESFVA